MKHKIVIALAGIMIFVSACDNQDLLDLNEDPNASSDINLEFLLARSTVGITSNNGMEIRANLIYASNMIQHNADTDGFTHGDKYTYNAGYSEAMWGSFYGDEIKLLTHIVDRTKGDDTKKNLYSMALAERAYLLHRLTDMYGNIPYEEAGRGLSGKWFPKYDTQDKVYEFLVRDLREARGLLTGSSNNIGGQDLLYGGDVALWKKFINGLLIRVGMRLTKVNVEMAKSIVEEAVGDSNGLFASNDEEAFIVHTEGGNDNTNGVAHPLRASETYANNLRPSKTFIDWMKAGSDPRLSIISGGVGDPFDETTWNTTMHIGLPNGYDPTTIVDWAISEGIIAAAGDYSVNEFSFINPILYNFDENAYILTYSEVQFNLAEAKLRGWSVGSGTAEEHFEAGVRSAIKRWEAFDSSLSVLTADINTYISGIGFRSSSSKMELIGEQYWAAQYFNHIEAWYNWRRTGFPVLVPVDYPGNVTMGIIPRRLRYPEGEKTGNPDNYASAIENQGEDKFITRVWWDKE